MKGIYANQQLTSYLMVQDWMFSCYYQKKIQECVLTISIHWAESTSHYNNTEK